MLLIITFSISDNDAQNIAINNTGNAPDANAIPVGKADADLAFAAAACIGCGACVAACKNASASLFVSAKISHLGLLPQGQPEREQRAISKPSSELPDITPSTLSSELDMTII